MKCVVLGACDLKTQHHWSSMYCQWPVLFWAVPAMTVCGERLKKCFKLAAVFGFCVCDHRVVGVV